MLGLAGTVDFSMTPVWAVTPKGMKEDGNPLEDLRAVTNTDKLKIIMKDKKIY